MLPKFQGQILLEDKLLFKGVSVNLSPTGVDNDETLIES